MNGIKKPTKRERKLAERRAAALASEAELRRLDTTRVLSTGALLRRAFTAWRPDAWKFAAVFAVTNLPILVVDAWGYLSAGSGVAGRTIGVWVHVLWTVLAGQVAVGAQGEDLRMRNWVAEHEAVLLVGASVIAGLLAGIRPRTRR